MDYLKTLQAVFQTDRAKRTYDKTTKLLMGRSPEEIRMIMNASLDVKFAVDILLEGGHMKE